MVAEDYSFCILRAILDHFHERIRFWSPNLPKFSVFVMKHLPSSRSSLLAESSMKGIPQRVEVILRKDLGLLRIVQLQLEFEVLMIVALEKLNSDFGIRYARLQNTVLVALKR